jgi:hypothetical protein
MPGFSVLLKEYDVLPHLEWGEDIAARLDMAVTPVHVMLRHHQGIVRKGLEKTRAESMENMKEQARYELTIRSLAIDR